MDALEKKKQLAEFEKTLKPLNVSELRELEEKLIKEAEDNDKRVTELEFNLPTDNYKAVAAGIQKLLNKQTVEWRFTYGLVSMYEFWDPENFKKKIKYPMLDGTLRTLGELKFTGYEEWAVVVAINKYFEALHQDYFEATESIYDIAAKHNAVMDELKLKEPHGDIPDAINTTETA